MSIVNIKNLRQQLNNEKKAAIEARKKAEKMLNTKQDEISKLKNELEKLKLEKFNTQKELQERMLLEQRERMKKITTNIVQKRNIQLRKKDKTFTSNLTNVIGYIVKNPLKSLTIMAALASLGVREQDQNRLIKGLKRDNKNLQDAYDKALNSSRYYKRAFENRARNEYSRKYLGTGPLSVGLNMKNDAKRRRKIKARERQLGPPPDYN
tara:strand:+ start:551 stop:1177 length:627 start_codon:yes stop_codon:yes gene_type:complete